MIILTLIGLLTHILLPLSSEAQLVNSSTPGSNNTTEIFQPNSQPFGLSYADWTLDGGNGPILYQERLILHTMTLGNIVPKVEVVLSGF